MKVSHSTRTAILQYIDPACTAAQEHVQTRIRNFHFKSVFLPNCGYSRSCPGSCNWWRNWINPYFSFGNSFNEKYISEHTDIPATTDLGLPNLCMNSSESLANRYEIEK